MGHDTLQCRKHPVEVCWIITYTWSFALRECSLVMCSFVLDLACDNDVDPASLFTFVK